jgi:hypothetical protein
MADTVVLPAGFKADARYAIMCVAVLGEFLQGTLPSHDAFFSSHHPRSTPRCAPLKLTDYLPFPPSGGLFFGWNALSIMIVDLGNYSEGCYPEYPSEIPGKKNNNHPTASPISSFFFSST